MDGHLSLAVRNYRRGAICTVYDGETPVAECHLDHQTEAAQWHPRRHRDEEFGFRKARQLAYRRRRRGLRKERRERRAEERRHVL